MSVESYFLADAADRLVLQRPDGLEEPAWEAIDDPLQRLNRALAASDLPLIVGTCKDLTEAVAKVVLTVRGDTVASNEDFQTLTGRAQAARGLSEGHHPAVDLRATLVDGRAHSVDSSDAAFQTAGALALREAAAACGTMLLEPLDEVAVRVPDAHLGAVLGDLSARRGRVLGTDVAGPGRSLVRAEVPRIELLRYAVDLRAITAGTATFTRRFAHWATAPAG